MVAAMHTSEPSSRVLTTGLTDAHRADWHVGCLQPVPLGIRQALWRIQAYRTVRHEAAPRPVTETDH